MIEAGGKTDLWFTSQVLSNLLLIAMLRYIIG